MNSMTNPVVGKNSYYHVGRIGKELVRPDSARAAAGKQGCYNNAVLKHATD